VIAALEVAAKARGLPFDPALVTVQPLGDGAILGSVPVAARIDMEALKEGQTTHLLLVDSPQDNIALAGQQLRDGIFDVKAFVNVSPEGTRPTAKVQLRDADGQTAADFRAAVAFTNEPPPEFLTSEPSSFVNQLRIEGDVDVVSPAPGFGQPLGAPPERTCAQECGERACKQCAPDTGFNPSTRLCGIAPGGNAMRGGECYNREYSKCWNAECNIAKATLQLGLAATGATGAALVRRGIAILLAGDLL
jgi:hypothetical protein